MSKPPVHLQTLLSAAALRMWVTFLDSGACSRPDHIGEPREAEVRRFLRTKLPNRFGVSRGHVIYCGNQVSKEFDIIVHDLLDAPRWELEGGEDPRVLIPLDAVVGVVEVKSTLCDSTLTDALKKLGELDEMVRRAELDDQPFRYVFAYQQQPEEAWGDWPSLDARLSSYASAPCQPDGVFVLNTGYWTQASTALLARGYALREGHSLAATFASNQDLHEDDLNRMVHADPSYMNDYARWTGADGSLLLAFITFMVERCSNHQARPTNYADMLSTWTK